MNKYQEALTFFIKDRCFSFEEANDVFIHKLNLQKLIDKEIPVKPKILNIGEEGSMMALVSLGCCENSYYCFRDKVFEEKYCSNCGQKLDWSDET